MLRPEVSLLALMAASSAIADHSTLEEVLVTASYNKRSINISQSNVVAPDAASLLKQAPVANVNSNCPLTGIAQYRGMYGQRVHTSIDGAKISSGGPNAMDSALSYAPTELLESMEIYRGIAPVSAGQETIGGAINVKTWNVDFGSSETFEISGKARTGYQSVDEGWLANAIVFAANQNHRFKLATLTEQGNDAEFDSGKILPSEYHRQRYDLGYCYQRDKHKIQLDIARNKTGETGTPALPMDIDNIDSDLASATYTFAESDFTLNGKIYYSDIKHGMTNYHLRTAPTNPMMHRRNITTAENIGYKLNAKFVDANNDKNTWLMGIDSHSEKHHANIDNPNNPMFFVAGFNNAERDVLGVFVER